MFIHCFIFFLLVQKWPHFSTQYRGGKNRLYFSLFILTKKKTKRLPKVWQFMDDGSSQKTGTGTFTKITRTLKLVYSLSPSDLTLVRGMRRTGSGCVSGSALRDLVCPTDGAWAGVRGFWQSEHTEGGHWIHYIHDTPTNTQQSFVTFFNICIFSTDDDFVFNRIRHSCFWYKFTFLKSYCKHNSMLIKYSCNFT